MEIIPTGKRLLVKQDAPDKQVGQIFLHAEAQKAKSTWTVVAISPELDLTHYKKGDRLFIPLHAGTLLDTLPGAGADLRLVTVDEVLAIIKE